MALIIFCETLFLKKRYFKTSDTIKIVEAVSVANVISTVFGGLLLWTVFLCYVFWSDSYSLGYLFLGPLYGILIYLPRNSAVEIFDFVFILVFYNVFFCFFVFHIQTILSIGVRICLAININFIIRSGKIKLIFLPLAGN